MGSKVEIIGDWLIADGYWPYVRSAKPALKPPNPEPLNL
jgi:hypothetical protein